MSLAALIAMVAICLTAGRGWFGDLLGQVIFGAMLGLALLEGCWRSVCFLSQDQASRLPVAFTPLVLFAFPVYALTLVESIYFYSIGISCLLAGVVGSIIFWAELCDGVIREMNDFTSNIGHHGG